MEMGFQVCDVKRALAAVSRITAKGNRVSFGPDEGDNFIQNVNMSILNRAPTVQEISENHTHLQNFCEETVFQVLNTGKNLDILTEEQTQVLSNFE